MLYNVWDPLPPQEVQDFGTDRGSIGKIWKHTDPGIRGHNTTGASDRLLVQCADRCYDKRSRTRYK